MRPRRAWSTRTTAAAPRQAHSGTHIIHAALRQVLGSNAHQSGSYNKAGYLRLDFSWNQALSAETRSEIEEISNNAIRAEPRGRHPRAAPRRGEVARRHGAVRREVRRRRARRRHRRPLVARALRGNARHDELRDRHDQPGQRVVGRFDEPPRRVAGRPRGVPGSRGRARPSCRSSRVPSRRRASSCRRRSPTSMANLKAAEKRIAAFEARAVLDKVPALLEAATRRGAVDRRRGGRRNAELGGRPAPARHHGARAARVGRGDGRPRGSCRRQARRHRRHEPGGARRRRQRRCAREDRRRSARRRRWRQGRPRPGRRHGRRTRSRRR